MSILMVSITIVCVLAFAGCPNEPVPRPVTGISLDREELTMLVGSTMQLSATLTPADATENSVSWISLNEDVATVSATGLISAIAPGSATIIAAADSGKVASCFVRADYTGRAPETITAGGVTICMAYVPGKTFPINYDDSSTATVQAPFLIADTEVTWLLWTTVRNWAIANGYAFQNTGMKGNDGAENKSDRHPVTTINWRDCIVWCNAATEWCNANAGTSLDCVYRDGASAVIRDSRDTNAAVCDAVVVQTGALGFRLPTVAEAELASRWRNDATNSVPGYSAPWFTQGDSASGADADYTNLDVCLAVAWFDLNGNSSTRPVALLEPNDLMLYDMSGNVFEWCFDPGSGTTRQSRGGSWAYNSGYLPQGFFWEGEPTVCQIDLGFRLVRTAE
jgi:formylglycine-generating enzyme required for sulfatase activity